jgi:hypothetical protein
MELIACAILSSLSLKEWWVVYGTRTWFSFKDGAVKIVGESSFFITYQKETSAILST